MLPDGYLIGRLVLDQLGFAGLYPTYQIVDIPEEIAEVYS